MVSETKIEKKNAEAKINIATMSNESKAASDSRCVRVDVEINVFDCKTLCAVCVENVACVQN